MPDRFNVSKEREHKLEAFMNEGNKLALYEVTDSRGSDFHVVCTERVAQLLDEALNAMAAHCRSIASASTIKKAVAVRENGKKGGRPKLSKCGSIMNSMRFEGNTSVLFTCCRAKGHDGQHYDGLRSW